MLRQLYLFGLIVLFTVILVACTVEEEPSYDRLFELEFERIASQIPSEFDADLRLPGASSAFVLTYEINGDVLDGYTMEYIEPDDDIVYNLDIILGYQEQTKTYSLTITELAVPDDEPEEPVEEPDDTESLLNYIDQAIPDPIISNVTLDQSSPLIEEISYSTTCGEVERGRLVYSFPATEFNCTITYSITIDQTVETLELQRTVSSVDNLPQLPRIYINTTNQQSIDSKEYVPGSVTLVTYTDLPYPELFNESMQVRLRGNSTLFEAKKSFKIKFDEQTRLLSHYPERDWVLLANFMDQSLIRNGLAFSLANRVGMPYAPSYTFVDVYVNGEYQGNYLLTDQIEITGDRIDIEENVPDIDTGYLFEWDYIQFNPGLANPDANTFFVEGIPFVLRSPDWEDDHYRDGHMTYIEAYMNEVFATLASGADYDHLIDEASFIDWFIVSEVFKNVDVAYSSVYFYKPKGGTLHMGPVWDFDLSTGNQGHDSEENRAPLGWHTSQRNIMFMYLMDYPEFRTALQERWIELYEPVILPTIDEVWMMADSITQSQYNNFNTWDIIGTNWSWYTAPEIYALTTYDEQVWFLHDYLVTRIAWLDEAIRDL